MDVESPSDLLNVQKFMKKNEEEENDAPGTLGGDNASLEVHLGDDSCHVSDVSSLSLQNIAIDDDEVNSEEGRLGRRDSMESTDSLPRDEPVDIRIPPPSPPSPASLSPSSTIRKRINDSPPAPKLSPGLACRIMPKPAPEIENEYNYVKYARTNANNYVGMRLADVCSSREASPEKNVPMPIHRSSPCTLKLNDEALTEIPLTVQTIRTTSNGLTSSESNKNFTLSPEHTECGDSTTDADSFVSDGAGTHSSSPGMPNVEDGLSSGTGSDLEENSPTLDKSPTAVLRRKHCGSIDKIYKGENGSEINPIEPIWVMRDTYVRKMQRQDEMRKVRDEIERQQEEEYHKRKQQGLIKEDEEISPGDSINLKTKPRANTKGASVEAYEEMASNNYNSQRLTYNRYASKSESSISSLIRQSEEEEEGKDGNSTAYIRHQDGDFDTDEETDELLEKQYERNEKIDIPELKKPIVNKSALAQKRRSKAKEVLIEGVLFRARYLGSTQLISEGQPSKSMRMMQAQEAVGRIKASAPDGENQPSTEVDLFVSTEKIMVLNTDLQEIMMDHSLRTISYIADIGDIVVIMARRRMLASSPGDETLIKKKQTKILCHVFESDEAQLIAQSIGQAFQVAYMEFLKANGIEDTSLMKEMDYQEVLNQQEIFGEELYMFANKDMQKEVIVPKGKGECLGVVIVESGWGSMVPTVVLANMLPGGPASRCGLLNIGDQIISVNGVSLVGLPISSAQNYIKATKTQTAVKLTVVSCPPVVEVCIKRPDVKYQLGFSVQNGVICSLLRGGIAERGGVRVGHRIIEINSTSVVAVPHEKIVNMLATSVGEIHMKTMPTSIFRLLTGQETPHFI